MHHFQERAFLWSMEFIFPFPSFPRLSIPALSNLPLYVRIS